MMTTRGLFILAAAGALGGGACAAQASTIETFQWVSTSFTAGGSKPTGTLQITLPGTVTGNTWSVSNASAAAAKAEITGFNFDFSDGVTMSLSDLLTPVAPNTSTFTMASPFAWKTSNQVTPSGGSLGYYLISGFTFGGHKNWGTGLGNFSLAATAGLVGNVAKDSYNVTPAAGGPAAAVDAGYWQLQPVPLPPGLPLLISGIVGLALLTRKQFAVDWKLTGRLS